MPKHKSWTLLPQERQDQCYFFSGKCFVTIGVRLIVNIQDVYKMIAEVQAKARDLGGIDYLQVFQSDEGEKVWLIDQLNADMIEEHPPEHHYFTILLPSEY